MSSEGAAGIMGNLQAESACESIRLEGDFTADRHISKEYVRKTDSGEYDGSLFAGDGKGFGLAQWTYPARKRDLLSFCRGRGASVGDLDAQLGFLVTELQSEYAQLWKFLKDCSDIRTAAERVLKEYERPAVLNTETRAGLAREMFLRFDGIAEPQNNEEKEKKEIKEQIIALLERL